MAIDYKPFIHPEDRDALNKLQAIPGLDMLMKKFMQSVTEDMMHGINMASKIKLGPSQLPELYAILKDTCETLQIPEPEMFLEMDPIPNAYTYGDTKPFVVVNSHRLAFQGRVEGRHRTRMRAYSLPTCPLPFPCKSARFRRGRHWRIVWPRHHLRAAAVGAHVLDSPE